MLSFFENILEWSKFGRCYYELSRENFERPRSRISKWQYYFHFFSFLYAHKVMVIILSAYTRMDFSWGHFEGDIFFNFFNQNQQTINPFIAVTMYLFELFNFVCHSALYHLNVYRITWQWWLQLVVINQDQYRRCVLSEDKLANAVQTKVTQLRSRLVCCRYTFAKLLPRLILQSCCSLLARIEIFLSLDNIDKQQLFSQPLDILPNLSKKLRSRLLITLILADVLCLICQIIISMLIVLY